MSNPLVPFMLNDWYPAVKAIHVSLVCASGVLFCTRGLAILAGASWPLGRPTRLLSQLLDSALLIAALTLLIALSLNPFATPWLLAKLVLLVAYVSLGVMAFRGVRSRSGKALAFVAAMSCFLMMVSIATSHDPLGFLR